MNKGTYTYEYPHPAVTIACILPNPLVRTPQTISIKNQSKYHTIYKLTQVTPYPFECATQSFLLKSYQLFNK